MKKHNDVVVIKVGGSLLGWPELPGRLAAFLDGLRNQDRAGRFLLITGGGAAADVVRSMDRVHGLGDAQAHWLAIRALDFTAELLAALLPGAVVVCRPEELISTWNLGELPILAPYRFLREIDARGPDPLRASWDVTSDSIAARIAVHLQASKLIVIKSRSVPVKTSCEEAARLGVVDPMFPTIARSLEAVESVCLRQNEAPLPLS